MDTIQTYLTNQATLVDDMNIEQTNHRAMGYQMADGTLYKPGRNGVLLKCITQTEGITACSAELNFGLFGLFFQPEQYFSLTTF